jgi:hypothetical protein
MPINEQILQRLRKNDVTLTNLILSYSRISDTELKELAEAVVKNTSLKSLSLH